MRLLFVLQTCRWSWRRSLPVRVVVGLCLSVCILFTGCSSLTKKREEQDLLEAELRGQERHIQELKAEVERKEGAIHSLDVEVEKLQQAALGKKQAGGEPQPPGVLKEITLGRLTGGYRANPKLLYDDSLQFLIEPRDPDGHTIKAPGSMHIELFEITPAGLKVPLSAWDITHREVRRSWDQPLIGGSAYRILIPFKSLPILDKMRVVVRFTTLEGQLYEAEKDFTIRLPGPGMAPVIPMGAVTPGGYSVVTPGHMINGTLVGPMAGPQGMGRTVPSAPIMEGTGRATTGALDLPAPPVFQEPAKQPEKKVDPSAVPEKKQEPIQQVPVEPRKTPATVPATIENKGNEPPPLPPPPEVPQFDKKGMSYEMLPSPSVVARTAQPLTPTNSDIVQAGYESSPLLTSPPPAEWKQKVNSGLVQVDYTGQAPIRLSRPVVVK